MLLSILKVPELPASTDATDAVAVAVCHHFARNGQPRNRSKGGGTRSGDWSSFVRNNPDRVR
jgi:crossover junction endodeoxyribonuclease RuvC